MIRVNDNFKELPSVYLFTQISRIINKYRETKDNIPLIRMDIGDVGGPLPHESAKAMVKAVEDLSTVEGFRGYGPEQGYPFLRNIIADTDYQKLNIPIDPSEIFISDGAKCDLGNLGDILSKESKIAVMDPSYPAYIDDNVIDGRSGKLEGGTYSEITYLQCDAEKNFSPRIPETAVDIVYLCSPNNPTGTCMSRKELEKWVDYARLKKILLIYDSAYEAYIRTKDIPRSIFEIPGAKEVAIEIRSFSKTGGFTGVRCGYTVVPHEIVGYYKDGTAVTLNSLWSRRQTTKFNGASYVSQRGAEALYTKEGRAEVKKMTDLYLSNAKELREVFEKEGWKVSGGEDSPYVWAKNPYGKSSEEIFKLFLEECGVSTTPGTGFGEAGAGYIRLSGFNTKENTSKAIERISELLQNRKTL